MYRYLLVCIAFLLITKLSDSDDSFKNIKAHLNVLLIIIDDLRPQLGVYGHNETLSPNINQLAQTGITFDHAYTNYPFCSPSRNSFMSGRMPSKTKVWNFIDSFRDVGQSWTALPELFKKNGYWTVGSGKLYHPDKPPNEDNPRSWSVTFVDPGGNEGCNCESTPGGDKGKEFCALPNDVSPQNCTDIEISDTVDMYIRAAAKQEKNFFIGLGIHKPHLPWGAPKRFYDIYPPSSDFKIAKHPDVPLGMPPIAFHYCDWDHFPHNFTHGHPVSKSVAQDARRAYFSAVSFMDNLVGKAIKTLNDVGHRNDTIILLTADHGWQLGEHCEWCKQTLFETSLNIPLIISDPTSPEMHGKRTQAFAELIDLYRTLADLAGIENVESGVDGTSLASVVKGGSGKTAAFSQMARCVHDPKAPWLAQDSCAKTNSTEIDWMGFSVRVENWRFNQWVKWNGDALLPNFDIVNASELYDHRGCNSLYCNADFDRWENENVFGKHPDIEQKLASMLKQHFTS